MPDSANFKDAFLKGAVGALAMSIIAVIVSLDLREDYSQASDALQSTRHTVEEAEATIKYLDEVLTMSARMGAATGDPSWEARYKGQEVRLDKAIKELAGDSSTPGEALAARRLDQANLFLVSLERQAFALSRAGRRSEASRLLAGSPYSRGKAEYARQNEEFVSAAYARLNKKRTELSRQRDRAVLQSAGLAVLAALAWLPLVLVVYRRLAEQMRAQAAVLEAHRKTELDLHFKTGALQAASDSLAQSRKDCASAEVLLKAQYEVALRLAQSDGADDPLLAVLAIICKTIGWKEAAIWTVPENGGPLVNSGFYQTEAGSGEFEAITRKITFAQGVGLPGRVWATGEPAWIENVQVDPNFPRAPFAAKDGLHSAFGLPLVSSGRILGVMEFFRTETSPPDDRLLGAMKTIGTHVGQFLERSEARRAKDAAQGMLAQSQKMEAVGKLSGGIAHDFNNILTVVMGCCDNLKSSVDPDGPGALDLADIKDAADRAAKLTRQLLAFSRKQVLRPSDLNLNESIPSLERMLARLVPENIRLRFALQPPSCSVRIDATQLDQVLLNLVVNAVDAMPNGGYLLVETGRFLLEPKHSAAYPELKPGPHATIVVSDTGTGMSPEIAKSVFEPFFTTKRAGQGTGLGLATVYGVVRQSGGAIRLDTEPGKGSRFTIFLPAVEEKPKPPAPAPAHPGRGMGTVLLVDDEDSVRRTVGRMLSGCGYQVLTASSAEQALERLNRPDFQVELLLTDVVMTGMNGRDLARGARLKRPTLPVLLMSGYVSELLPDLTGADAEFPLIEKPFSPQALAREVCKTLAG